MKLNIKNPEKNIRLVFFNPMGAPSSIWGSIIHRLKNNFEIVTYEYPGLEKTDYLHINSIETYAEMLESSLEKLPKKSTVLVGYSLGGWVAQQIAMKNRWEDHALVLIAASEHVHPKGLEIMRHWKSLLELQALDLFLKELILWNFSGEFLLKEPNLFPYLLKALKENLVKKVYLDHIEMAIQYTNPQPVEKIKIPTLLIEGTEDALFPRFGIKELKRKILSSHTKRVRGGHALLQECPEEVFKHINYFLNNYSLEG